MPAAARRPWLGALTTRLVPWALAVLLASCAQPPPAKREAPRIPLWPAPPELPRFVYETALRAPADIGAGQGDLDLLRRRLTGDMPPNQSVLNKPNAVAARGGRIYVSDTVERHIVVFDVPRRTVFRFGLRPPGTLRKPTALALDGGGHVYVADATRRQVFVYDALGLFERTIGSATDLIRPTGVAVDRSGRRIYVIDRADNESDRHRVVVYDGNGTPLAEIGGRGAEEGLFNIPVQAAVAPDGTLYVLDAGNFRVQAFAPDGRFLRAFGGPGATPGSFGRPRGIAVDEDGNVYVSDAAFGNIQVFDAQGRLLLALGQLGVRDAPGRFALPAGVFVDETRRLYAVDQYFAKVEVIRRLSEAEGERLRAQAGGGEP